MNEDPKILRRHAFAKAKELGLRREERLELAEWLLKKDVSTWDSLAPGDFLELVKAMEGFHLIWTLLNLRATRSSVAGSQSPGTSSSSPS